MKRNRHSLKWKFLLYMPICTVLAIAGSFGIGIATNDLQDWYLKKHTDIKIRQGVAYEIYVDEHGHETVVYVGEGGRSALLDAKRYQNTFWLISNAQMIIIPTWVFLCILMTGIIFYNRELKKPIEILLDSSKKIADNQLDFKIEYKKQNELGALCTAFDEMRSALYENNRELWRSLEERKRLNSAFSHDLRTPLTVLKGYTEFLEKYVPDGRVSEEKLMGVIAMMNGQIVRLEHYTQKMNAVQKLEDIVPNERKLTAAELFGMLSETGGLVCGDMFGMDTAADSLAVCIDTELVMQVYENLISNAARYAEGSVRVKCVVRKDMLDISVSDDGGGFSEEALRNASQPFYRDDKEDDKLHFGLGLYICRIICEKCGGCLTVKNHEGGGMVTASFSCGEKAQSR